MTALEEALAMAEAMNVQSETWTRLQQYELKSFYSDDDVPINIEGRDIGDLSGNISTLGENNSQYISFIMGRYADGVDLSTMLIQIQYELEDGSGSTGRPVNAYASDSQIRFGWAIPDVITQKEQTIRIIVFCTGSLNDGQSYILKTRPVTYTTEYTLSTGGTIPKPDEDWYLQFVNVLNEKVVQAADSASVAIEASSRIEDIYSDVSASKDVVENLAAQVQSNASIAQESATVARASEQNSKESEEKAKTYAENASAVTGVEIAKKDRAGLVKGGENTIAEDGTLELTRKTTNRTLTDSYAGGLKINEVDGASEQAQYSGKNLMPVNYFSGSVYTEYSISLPSGDYYITAKVTSSDTDSTESLMLLNYTDGTQANVFFTRGARVRQKVTFAKDISSIRVYASNNFVNSSNDTFTWEDVMISVEDIDYEPYTGNAPSPSPEYPQPIKSVGDSGSLEIKTHVNQLLNYEAWKTVTTTRGTSVFENNGVTLTATAQDAFTSSSLSEDARIYVSEGDTITMTWDTDATSGNNGYVYIFTDSGENVYTYATAKKCSMKIKSGVTYATFRFGVSNAGHTIHYKNIMIDKKGGLPYEPYQKPNTITIPLSEPLRQYDKIVKLDGVWGVERGTKRDVFDGSSDEIWGDSTYSQPGDSSLTVYGIQEVPGVISKDTKPSFCNSFSWNLTRGMLNTYQMRDVYSIAFCVAKEKFPTLADWKIWVVSNPITVEHAIETPTFEPFDTEVQIALNGLTTYDGVTYVSTNSEIEPVIKLEYGTSRVGGYALEALNTANRNELHISALTQLTNDLAARAVAGSEG